MSQYLEQRRMITEYTAAMNGIRPMFWFIVYLLLNVVRTKLWTYTLYFGRCIDCDVIIAQVFLWFGYASSTLNPIIYTVFNREFKNTFLRLLRCHCSAADGGAEGRVSQLQMLVRQNPHLVNGGAMLAIRALRPRGVATDNSTAHWTMTSRFLQQWRHSVRSYCMMLTCYWYSVQFVR